MVYPCSCSRQDLAARRASQDLEENDAPVYAGTCRNGPRRSGMPLALRFRAADRVLQFDDGLQGPCVQNVAREVGDFIVRRRDGLHAYQLAVVVDDANQQITEVVRGCDLLSNTPRQMLLQQALGISPPQYLHLPLLLEADGRKLAKSRRSVPVTPANAAAHLHAALSRLRQRPPAELAQATAQEAMRWAVKHWDPAPLKGQREVRLDAV